MDRFRFSPSRGTRKNTYATKLVGNRMNIESNSSSSSSSSKRSGSKRSGSKRSGTNSNAAYVSSGEMRRRRTVKAAKKGKTARELQNEDVMKVKLPKDMGYRAAMDNKAFKYRVDQLKHSGYKFHEARGGFAVFTRAVKA